MVIDPAVEGGDGRLGRADSFARSQDCEGASLSSQPAGVCWSARRHKARPRSDANDRLWARANPTLRPMRDIARAGGARAMEATSSL